MAIAQPNTDNLAQDVQTLRSDITSRVAGIRDRARNTGPGATPGQPGESGPAATGNGAGPMAADIPTPPGWRPIELDLPVPGSQTPYHLSGPNPNALRQSAQGYGQAIRTGVQGMIPPHTQTAPYSQQPPETWAWMQPFLHSFLDYLKNQHTATAQPMPPQGGNPAPGGGNPLESLFQYLANKR